MTPSTLEIPLAQLPAFRDSVAAHLAELEADPDRAIAADTLATLADLIAQADAGLAAHGLTGRIVGPLPLVWRALYDVVCQLADLVRDDCDDYWTGVVDPAELRGDLRALAECSELMISLGPSPDAP
jgi:hypothetical protein